MGGALGVNMDFTSGKIESKNLDDADRRRRNSLAFYISQFVAFDGVDFEPLVEAVREDQKQVHGGGKSTVIRHSKFSKLADTILQGNMKELRNQVVVYFKSINRKYKDQHLSNHLVHLVCQEGYFNMLSFMTNPANRSQLDQNEIELNPRNERNRTPLFLCFTPPTATYLGQKFGVSADGAPNSEKPEEIENDADWMKPGGPKSRENCIKLLVDKGGADVNDKDFHDFTALHYAAIWGWTSTVKFLLYRGADINAMTIAGRTALMYAVQYQHESLVLLLAYDKNTLIDAADTEGYTALIIAVELGVDGMGMVKTLLKKGADPNILTLRRKSALKIACASQNLELINLLLDYKAQRRNSAFNLLETEGMKKIQERLKNEEKEEEKRLEKLAKEKQSQEYQGLGDGRSTKKNPWGSWVDYKDKLSKKIFYYNTVTRVSTFEKPRDFQPDKNRVPKEVTFGMSFYH